MLNRIEPLRLIQLLKILKFFRGFTLNTPILLSFLVLSSTNLCAQETLTIEQAVELALKNNYDIQIAKNDAEIAARNNTVGNAGMLPKVNATVRDSQHEKS